MGSNKRAQLRQQKRYPNRQPDREQDPSEYYPLGMLEQVADGKHQKVAGQYTGYIKGGMRKSLASSARTAGSVESRRQARINKANEKMRKALRNG